MKRFCIALFMCMMSSVLVHAIVSKTVTLTTAGTLSSTLTSAQKSTITDLTIIGNIDARDFLTMRDNMSSLLVVNMTDAVIQPYTGFNGTNYDTSVSTVYPKDEIPRNALGHSISLKNVLLPKNLVSIGDFAFYSDLSLTGPIVLPSTLKRIGEAAFDNCTSLKGPLVFPSAMTRIGRLAFYDCRSLTGSITIPDSISTIEFGLFSGCSSLVGPLSLPSTLTSIESFAFRFCSNLTGTLPLPIGLTSLGQSAFEGCSKLTGSIVLPPAIKTIEGGVFAQCSSLTGPLILHEGLTSIGSSAFSGCKGLTGSLTIPSKIKSVGQLAFSGCSGLSGTLTLPNAVTNLYYGCFWGCSNFRDIRVYGQSPYNVQTESMVFSDIPVDSCQLHVRTGSKSYFQGSTPWSGFKTIIEGLPAIASTQAVTNPKSATPTGNGSITSLDPGLATKYGIVWSTSPNPTVALPSKSEAGPTSSALAFALPIQNLLSNTLYYVRAYATNGLGTNYGEEVSFVSTEFKPLTIGAPTVVTNKMVDQNTTAQIIKLAKLEGVESADSLNVTISATANYNNALVGTNKTITVKYQLGGTAASKYAVPNDWVITNAKISDNVTLTPLSTNFLGEEGSDLLLPYNIATGTPTQYKVTYSATGLSAGMQHVAYVDLPTSALDDTLHLPMPERSADSRKYQGTLRLRNELGVESPNYPFEFTLFVSADRIVTKFDDVVLIDNTDNRFTGFQWYKNNALIEHATEQFYCDPNRLSGIYTVRLTDSDGKSMFTFGKGVVVAENQQVLSVFPNPAKASEPCFVRLAGITEDELGNATLTVHDAQGSLLLAKKNLDSTVRLDLPNQGAYVVQVKAKGSVHVFKVIVLN